jgi:hypothetical protein
MSLFLAPFKGFLARWQVVALDTQERVLTHENNTARLHEDHIPRPVYAWKTRAILRRHHGCYF